MITGDVRLPALASRLAAQERLGQEIGPVATQLDAAGAVQYAFGWFSCVCIFLPLGLWAEVGAPRIVWVPAGLARLAGVVVFVMSLRTNSRAAREAEAYVGKQLGFPIEIRPVGYTVQLRGYSTRWSRNIAAGQAEHQRRMERLQLGGWQAAVDDAVSRRRRSLRLAVPAVVMIGFVVGVYASFAIALVVPSWTVPIVSVAAFFVCAFVPAVWVRVRCNDSLERLRTRVTDELQ
jgi:hypothetical protein